MALKPRTSVARSVPAAVEGVFAPMNGTHIQGTLSRICFHRDRFLIGRLDDDTTVKGTLLHPQIGLAYTLTGRWERHPRWGTQFTFTDYEAVYPTDQDAVRAYLREQCRWIGPAISRRLVETYGEDSCACARTIRSASRPRSTD